MVVVRASMDIGLYVVKPDLYSAALNKLSSAASSGDLEAVAAEQKQAKFGNLDGKVQVKKVNSVQWVEADYRTTLDKGDEIKTADDGAARITFADGTTYTVKPGTFITVEENSMGRERPSSSAVRINTGQVDLTTPRYSSPDSRAAVSTEDANAQLRSNSRMAGNNDPVKKESEIWVSGGTAQVVRGAEKIHLAPWEKATIPIGRPIQRSNVLAPPDSAGPLNLAPITAEHPTISSVHFE